MGFLKIKNILVIAFILTSSLCIAQSEDGFEYERNSMHVMMIRHLNQKFDDIIEDVFLKMPFPQRFNNHDLGVKTMSFAESEGDQSNNIASFISQVNLGKKMIAKWFDRDKTTGSFDVELIKSRGFYNATHNQKEIARSTARGMTLIEDAGENLISKTFLLISDIRYKSKGSVSWFIKGMLNAYFGNIKGLQDAMQSIGGFKVIITSYLFQLDWNEEIAYEFYTKYYTENGNADADKVKAFVSDNELFTMKYVGKTESESSEVNFASSKDPKALLVKVSTRTLDLNIAQLQHQYADFRIKAPILTTEPISADVGKKEDINENSRFEVLERVLNDDGKIVYERVGIVKPKKGKIKDNRFMSAEDESSEASFEVTEFEKISGKEILPGMFIREIR